MNERRFQELLNLYLDHEIAPAEASELEAEVLRNPERRRVYDQYCRLQRACCLLGEHERALAPTSHRFARSLRDAERKIASPRRSFWWRPVYAGAFTTAAMAACVVVVLVVNRTAQTTGSTELIAENGQSAVVPVETIAPRMVAATVVQPQPVATVFEFQPVLASTGLGAVRNAREAEIAANDREALEWMQRVELLPIHRVVVDDQAFDSRPTLQPDNRVFRSRHALQGTAEFTAFQFQR